MEMEYQTGAKQDFSELQSEEAYSAYFGLLSRVGETLLNAYRGEDQDEDGVYEARMVQMFIAKFLYTIQTLRIKFTYSPAHNRHLWIDLSESGFPNHAEIAKLETDLLVKNEQLLDIPTESLLKMRLLDHLIANHEDSKDVLWQLSERAYLERLDLNQMFMAFTPGELVRQGDTHNRVYVYSWGCYDFASNRPYVHIMAFEQDANAEALESNPTAMRQFLKVIRAEGSRVPDLQILAASIDESLDQIYPKIIKRLCVGPLYSTLIHNGTANEQEEGACQLLGEYAEDADFMLYYTTEVIFSTSEQRSTGMFSRGKIRQIFHVPATDHEAFRRRASVVHQNVLMPHLVRQHMSVEDITRLALNGMRILTYDERGVVHGS